VTGVAYLARLADSLGDMGGVVYRMERQGVPVDLDVCAEIRDQASLDADRTRTWLDNYVGAYTGRLAWQHNWNYAQWLKDVVHGPRPGGLAIAKSPYWSKGKVRPDEVKLDGRALEYLASTCPEHRQFLNQVRQLRRQQRMATYAQTWINLAIPHKDGTHRLHPAFGMASDFDDRPGARTGRFGIKNPPLQQVPRDKKKDPYRLRRAFVAPPGHLLLVADYSQLEIVILAHLADALFGRGLLSSRLRPGSPDLHSATAKYVFGDVLGESGMLTVPVEDVKSHPVYGRFRDLIKAVRYGLNYGKGEWGFGNTLFELDASGDICGPPLGEKRAKTMMEALLSFDPEVAQFQDWVRTFIRKHKAMPSLAGRWFPHPNAASHDQWLANREWRQACNEPMQAGGQEVTAAAMVRLDQAGFTMTLQVHDEIHALVPEDKAEAKAKEMKDIMETAWPLRAYLKAEPKYGLTWESTK
jgi:DNA polymerase I-like protein with 3'-5' exonuclease and polymerase domains